MHIVQAQRDDVLRPLQIVNGIVGRNAAQPILTNLVITKDGDALTLLSSDGEMQITTLSPIGLGKDTVATAVAARKLGDIVRNLPEGSEVKLSLTDKRMTVQCGKSRFALQTLPADGFPVMQAPDAWDASVTLPQRALKRLIEQVHIAMAQNDVRFYLNGMLLQLEASRVIGVATDGHRLAYAHVDVDEPLASRELILPGRVVMEMGRQLEHVSDPVTLHFAGNLLRCELDGTRLDTKVVEGQFPPYKKVIPTGYPNTFVIRRTLLQASLHRAALLASEKTHAVLLHFSENLLRITAHNPKNEEAVEEVEIAYAGDVVELGLNVRYMLEVLSNLDDENVQVAVKDGGSSVMLTVPERDDFVYVCMPMKI